MRTDKEIIKRIEEIEYRDVFGFETIDLIARLPFDQAKPFLKPEASEQDWQPASRNRDDLLQEMLDYMPFAWEKANNCRGISACRTMHHYNTWTWLAGDDFGDLTGYQFYGKDNLVRICKHYGWDHTQWDDGKRVNSESELYESAA